MKKFKSLIATFLAVAVLASGGACSPEGDSNYSGYDESLRVEDTRDISDEEYSFLNVVGTDNYGRSIVTVDGKRKSDLYVGMFYFLTLGQHSNHAGIYDISKITVDGTDLDAFQVNSTASPLGKAHFWGEPVWGYYNSTDPWVIRKQIELLTMAGIDFIVLDTSNGVLYQAVTDVLFPILKEYSDQGWNVPKVMYYLQANSADNSTYMNSLETVYNYFYKSGEYSDLWFCPNGKPMITRHELATDTVLQQTKLPDDSEKSYYDFFEFKTRQWPINDYSKEDGASWMDFQYPQELHTDWMSVSVAQHYSVRFSDTIGTHGRGWNEETFENDHENYGKGLNYQSQWETAFSAKDDGLRYAFITGWNEWVAEKMYDGSTYFTVDTFNEEYSRDIEPSKNTTVADNFYLQTIQNVKAFNYTEAQHYIYPKLTIDTSSDSAQWNDVRAYKDFTGECVSRDAYAMVKTKKYTDTSNRNDIASIKVARNDEYLYFRVETVDDIKDYTENDTSWMNIWLKTDNGKNSYAGYNYVINRSVSGNKTSVFAATANGLTEKAQGEVYVYGNVMIVKVALSDLGLSSSNYHIEFKVTDNIQDITDYCNLYATGDSAPIGRLNYSYGY